MVTCQSVSAVVDQGNSSSSHYSKSTSRSTIGTGSLSSMSSSPPSSPSSFTRRRRTQQPDIPVARTGVTHSHRRDGSPLFVLNERRPPPASVSTATALSESVSYYSSDGEIDEEEAHCAETDSEGIGMPMSRPLATEEPSQFNNNFSTTSIDVEMGSMPGVMDSSVGNTSSSNRPPSPYHPPQWRRSTSSRHRFHSNNSSPPPSVASSVSSSSFRSRRNRPATYDSPNAHLSSSSTRQQQQHQSYNSGPLSLRASLDAGMAAVRSWIRLRGSSGAAVDHARSSEAIELRPRSRSVTWQTGPPVSSSVSIVSQNTTASEELDELLQLDDLSTHTNNSARTDDSCLSSNIRYRPASAPTVLPYRHGRQQEQRSTSVQHYISHPDTILEELDEGGECHMVSRKRSQSEPDGRQIPNFFLGPPPTTRYHLSSSNSSSARQRRHYQRTPNRYNGSHNPYRVSNQRQHRISQPSPFTRRINLPGRPRVEGDAGASLSTSAAAALYENPNVLLPATSLPECSDAGASVATTLSIPVESAIELAIPPINASEVASGAVTRPTSSTPTNRQSSPFRNNANGRDDRSHVTPSTTHVDSSLSDGPSGAETTSPNVAREESARSNSTSQSQVTDAERMARIRWIRINRRFQFVITVVALVFSLLLFAILICWVVLTSAYFLSFDKSCDVPLKRYFWLVTLQLVLDVFRSDIMRFVFNWDANSNQRIPIRVVAYNITYLVYALLVLRLGVRSVLIDSNTCQNTAPELFNSSAAFVSLSIAAWATILCGYLLPFCVVAALLTCNGYNPTSQNRPDEENVNRDRAATGTAQPVFPAAYATTGAPPGTIDRLTVVRLENIRGSSRECCICMEDFLDQDVLVETSCKHIFHKQCFREWLRQARTCPVCRSDIPGSLQAGGQAEPDSSSRIPIGPTGRPVVGLVRILRRTTGAIVQTMSTSSPSHVVRSAPNEERTTGN